MYLQDDDRWIQYKGLSNLVKLMDDGAASTVTQTGAGDSKAPFFTVAEIVNPRVYRTSLLPEQNRFVLTLGFSDGDDRAGVTRIRVRVFDPSEESFWLTWPSPDPDKDAKTGATVELLRDDTSASDDTESAAVTAGVVKFTVASADQYRFAAVGNYMVTEFRIEDATGLSYCVVYGGCVVGATENWRKSFQALFGSTNIPMFEVTNDPPPTITTTSTSLTTTTTTVTATTTTVAATKEPVPLTTASTPTTPAEEAIDDAVPDGDDESEGNANTEGGADGDGDGDTDTDVGGDGDTDSNAGAGNLDAASGSAAGVEEVEEQSSNDDWRAVDKKSKAGMGVGIAFGVLLFIAILVSFSLECRHSTEPLVIGPAIQEKDADRMMLSSPGAGGGVQRSDQVLNIASSYGNADDNGWNRGQYDGAIPEDQASVAGGVSVGAGSVGGMNPVFDVEPDTSSMFESSTTEQHHMPGRKTTMRLPPSSNEATAASEAVASPTSVAYVASPPRPISVNRPLSFDPTMFEEGRPTMHHVTGL